MNLNDREWKDFKIDEIFLVNIYNGKSKVPTGSYIPKECFTNGKTPRITVTSINNGIENFYADTDHKNYREIENAITVSFLGNVFYHPYKASIDMKVHALYLKNQDLNFDLANFLILAIRKSVKNFSYGNQLSSTDLPRVTILLPIDSEQQPDFKFMEDYSKFVKHKLKTNIQNFYNNEIIKLEYKYIPSLDDKNWKPFFIGGKHGVFTIKSSNSGIDSKKLYKTGYYERYPYISRKDTNNGIKTFVHPSDQEVEKINIGNVITIGLDTQTVFYQSYPFFTGQNIQVLESQFLNEYNGLFIATLLKKQMKKFSWGGNGATLKRLNRTSALFPVNSKNNIDFQYMEDYTKNMILKLIDSYFEIA